MEPDTDNTGIELSASAYAMLTTIGRRGRPRTRMDGDSDLQLRIKTGDEIRSYDRKAKTENTEPPKEMIRSYDRKRNTVTGVTKTSKPENLESMDSRTSVVVQNSKTANLESISSSDNKIIESGEDIRSHDCKVKTEGFSMTPKIAHPRIPGMKRPEVKKVKTPISAADDHGLPSPQANLLRQLSAIVSDKSDKVVPIQFRNAKRSRSPSPEHNRLKSEHHDLKPAHNDHRQQPQAKWSTSTKCSMAWQPPRSYGKKTDSSVLTIASSISDSAKLQLLQSNTLVNKKLYDGKKISFDSPSLTPLETTTTPDDPSDDNQNANKSDPIQINFPTSSSLETRTNSVAAAEAYWKASNTNRPRLLSAKPCPIVTDDALTLDELKKPPPVVRRYRSIAPAQQRVISMNQLTIKMKDNKTSYAKGSASATASELADVSSDGDSTAEDYNCKKTADYGAGPSQPSMSEEYTDATREMVEQVSKSQIKCFFCRFECYDRMDFFKHMQDHVMGKTSKCSRCEMEFVSDKKFKAHFMKEHCSCKLCGYIDLMPNGIMTHVTYHHETEKRICLDCKCGNLDPVDLENAIHGVNPVQCDACGCLTTYQDFFQTRFNLKFKTHKSLPFECRFCPYETRDEDAFSRHNVHHDKVKWQLLKCDLCDFLTSEKLTLEQHNLQHKKGLVFKCETCRFYTIGEGRMALHRTVHTGKKPHKCSYCSYMTVNPKVLSHHIKIHFDEINIRKANGELKVKCGQCDYRGSWNEVNSHIRSHAKQVPNTCIICSKDFQTKTGYKKHMQQHMGEFPFPCPECEKGFFDEYTLRDHIFTHQGIKPYGCVCGMRYQRKKNLVVHEKACDKFQQMLMRTYSRENVEEMEAMRDKSLFD